MALATDQMGDRAQAIAYAEAALTNFEIISDLRADRVRQQLSDWKTAKLAESYEA
jgi:hypothetical protein